MQILFDRRDSLCNQQLCCNARLISFDRSPCDAGAADVLPNKIDEVAIVAGNCKEAVHHICTLAEQQTERKSLSRN